MPLRIDIGAEPVPGYTLVRLLGRGGFGEVWEAIAPGEVRVALKFIRLDAEQAEPELRALEVIRDIRHPHLLDVQFTARVDDHLVIAMPLCGESLKDRLDACPAGLPRDELLGYMEDLARAVDYLNEPRHPSEDGTLVGVQHRDIKPGNVFLVGDSIRLADFGLAKVQEASMNIHSMRMSPPYAAPEVAEGRFTQWSDQYSLAVTYVHLRTGKLPFTGKSVYEILYAHVNKPPDLSNLAERERPVVGRALAKRPEERWPTCRAFARTLVTARGTDGDATSPAQDSTKFPETQEPRSIPSIPIDEGNLSTFRAGGNVEKALQAEEPFPSPEGSMEKEFLGRNAAEVSSEIVVYWFSVNGKSGVAR